MNKRCGIKTCTGVRDQVTGSRFQKLRIREGDCRSSFHSSDYITMQFCV